MEILVPESNHKLDGILPKLKAIHGKITGS